MKTWRSSYVCYLHNSFHFLVCRVAVLISRRCWGRIFQCRSSSSYSRFRQNCPPDFNNICGCAFRFSCMIKDIHIECEYSGVKKVVYMRFYKVYCIYLCFIINQYKNTGFYLYRYWHNVHILLYYYFIIILHMFIKKFQ